MSKEDYDIDKILSEIDNEDHTIDAPVDKVRLVDDLRPFDNSPAETDDPLSIDGEESSHRDTGGDGNPAFHEEETGANTSESPGDTAIPEPRDGTRTEPDKNLREAGPGPTGVFTLAGTKSWNRKEPYVIALNHAGLNTEKEYLAKTFHIIDTPEKITTLKEDLRTSLAKFMRKSGPGMLNEYREFLIAQIRTTVHELHDYFKFVDDQKNLFIYHLGPLSIYKMLNEKFTKTKFGDCFWYEAQSGKGIRFIPEEFMKETVLQWFQENINGLNLSFDSIQNYERIAKAVFQSYGIVKRNFLGRLDKLNSQLNPGKQISSKELVKLKGDKWFGIQNIVAYRRFVEKNIFN